MIRSEHVIGLLCLTLEYDNHESTHKKSAVDHLISLVRGAIVEDQIVRVVFIFKEPR